MLCRTICFFLDLYLFVYVLVYVYVFTDHKGQVTMAKGVAVLNSSEGVTGTIFFTQEGDGSSL
jgi:hypothetical protein